MKRGGTSIDRSQSRACSRRKTLRRCKINEAVDNVILIDVDSDNFNNVINIDVPESVPQKHNDFPTVICIEDDETAEENNIGIRVQGGGKFSYNGRFSRDGSCNTSSCPSSSSSQKSAEAVGDECQFVHENISPLRLSKCKRTYSEKGHPGNRYGLTPESLSASADDGITDCLYMEDSCGKLREQWEKAFLKRKHHVNNGVSCTRDQANAFKFCSDDTHLNVETEHKTEGQSTNATCSVHRETVCQSSPLGDLGTSCNTANCQEKGKSFSEDPCLVNMNCNDPHSYHRKSSEEVEKVYSETTSNRELHDVDVTHSGQEDSILTEREKLKETNEYKRAMMEEWAARERELQIQAEEAQRLRRLRKREKAESTRLLDMERRQKQRVEEVREAQKKDEENMTLKEQHRAEIRKELKQLELTSCDMASLLRGLGISVDGGFSPQPNEVRAAYKRALLRFHPDRASGSDIRQLVEAEEKFKLISRMREKLLVPTTTEKTATGNTTTKKTATKKTTTTTKTTRNHHM